MLLTNQAFSGYSVDDKQKAREFYTLALGFELKENSMDMGTVLKVKGGGEVFIYAKPNHEPATFTVLNIPTDDIDAAVDNLTAKGVVFEKYEGFGQDEKGIARAEKPEDGPSIAWFKDPAGNIISIIEATGFGASK